VSEDLTGRSQNRQAEITLGAERHEVVILREPRLKPCGVIADLASDCELAGGSSEVVLDVVDQTIAIPERQRSDAGLRPIGAFGDEGIGHLQRIGEIADKCGEELGAGRKGGAVGDGPHDVAGLVSLGFVAFLLGHWEILLDPPLVTESPSAASEERRPSMPPERFCRS